MSFHRQSGGFRLLGLGRQDFIKYFFGGNASLAVVILALMFVFLIREAFLFFPAHHRQLQVYRKSGLEYAALIEEALRPCLEHAGEVVRAYEAEAAYPQRELRQRLAAFDAARDFAREKAGTKLTLLKAAMERRALAGDGSETAARLDPLITRLKDELEARKPAIRKEMFRPRFAGIPLPWKRPRVDEMKGLEEAEQIRLADEALKPSLWETGGGPFRQDLQARLEAVSAESAKKLEPLRSLAELHGPAGLPGPLEAVWKEASGHSVRCRERALTNATIAPRVAAEIALFLESPEISVRQAKLGAALDLVAGAEFFDEYAKIFYVHRLTGVLKNLVPGEKAYLDLAPEIRSRAEAVLSAQGRHAKFVEFLNATKRTVDAFPQSVPEGSMEVEMRSLLHDLTRLDGGDAMIRKLAEEVPHFVKEFPFEEEAETLSTLTGRFEKGIEQLREEGRRKLADWPGPSQLESLAARKKLASYRENFETDLRQLEAAAARLRNWHFDRPWSPLETVAAFFFGKKWAPRDEVLARYGVVPLLAGSLAVSLIALGVAIPVSLAGAIYINQLAPWRERRFLRPAIEFIGAIPPVVLGFLGVAAAGEMTRKMEAGGFSSWLPDALAGRFPLLIAGILLGLMAAPVILALSEEALNRVPALLRDSSLSLGATRLQTAFRVVLPSALGGLLAAILLGFGRVIGETMVVLLVLGNRASPTLPGIIAESMGEAAPGSIDYHALFLAGWFLFTVTLIIHYLGQRLLSRVHPLE